MRSLEIRKPRLIHLLIAFAHVEMIRTIYRKGVLKKLDAGKLVRFQYEKISTMERLQKIHITNEEVVEFHNTVALELPRPKISRDRFLLILLAYCADGMDKMLMESIGNKKEETDRMLNRFFKRLLEFKTMKQIKATKTELIELHGAVMYFKIVGEADTLPFKK